MSVDVVFDDFEVFEASDVFVFSADVVSAEAVVITVVYSDEMVVTSVRS
jgi:hypothetical protein